MIFAFAYFLISSFLGFFLLKPLVKRKIISFLEGVVFGSVLGIAIFGLVIFVLALSFPLKTASMLTIFLCFAATGILATSYVSGFAPTKHFNYLKTHNTHKLLIFSILFWGALFFVLFWQTYLKPVGDWYSASPSTYGDLPLHLSFITNFAYGENFPPVNPLAPFTRLSYHFLSDFISSVILTFGTNLRFALIMPGVFLGALTAATLFVLVYRMSKSVLAAVIAPALFFLNGGIGFLKFFENIGSYGLVNAITSVHERYAHIPEWGVEYPNILAEILMAERALLLGIPLAITSIFFLYLWFDGRERLPILFAGLAMGLLPYANIYGYLTVGIFAFLLFGRDILFKRSLRVIKGWVVFALLGIGISAPFFVWIAPQVLQHESFLRFSPGEWPPLDSTAQKLSFWFTNFGLPPILATLAALKKEIATIVNRTFFGLLFLITFIAHFIVFQPFAWDNNRFVLYPYIAISVLAALTLARLISGRTLKRLLGTSFLVISISSGLLVALHDPQIRYPLYSSADFSFAEFLRRNTEPNALFLTARNHNHPVVSLAGRRIVFGYGGYLWTHGIGELPSRQNAMRTIYQGDNTIETLLNRYKIRYIVIGPWEQAEFPNLNQEKIAARYGVIYNKDGIKVFDVTLPPGG